MDAADVLQTVLSVIQSGANMTASSGASNTTGALSPEGGGGAPSLPQLLVMLFSTSAVRDWAKLLLIGAAIEGCRRTLNKSWEHIVDFFWLTATIECDDDTSEWVLFWLSQQKVFNTARNIEVSSHGYNLGEAAVDVLGEDAEADDRVTFVPSLNKKYFLWYQGRYMTVMREKRSVGGFSRPVEVLELSMLLRDPRLLRGLLSEARRTYKEACRHRINVYVTEGSDYWKHVATQDKRPASSVVLDPGVLELVLEDAREFMRSRKWYADRGIPFRRGYLLYGVPGAGKTSMIHCIAGELGLNIYILSLTMMGMDDNSLKSLIAHLPQACILLIEDIDAAFHRGMKRNIADPEKQARRFAGGDSDDDVPNGRTGKPEDTLVNGVTLSGLLNALDGIAAQEGRLLFATTNDYSALDPALLRPGRLDLHIDFQLASSYQARELYRRFYTPDEPPSGADIVVDEKGSGSRPAHSAPTSPASRPLPLDVESPTEESALLPESVRSVYVGMEHGAGRLPRLSAAEVDALADRFAAIVPARAFSMATLQGYLMAYKVRPLDALADAPAWVEKKLREKTAAAGSSSGSWTPAERQVNGDAAGERPEGVVAQSSH